MSAPRPIDLEIRREFLRQGLVSAGLVSVGAPAAWATQLPAVAPQVQTAEGLQALPFAAGFGALRPADANGVRLPTGFSSRIIARSGQKVGSTSFAWHSTPDGGACTPVSGGGWRYISNCELPSRAGGVSVIEFNSTGSITRAYQICSGTSRNCAGGMTPWGTWITCEEVENGRAIECDPAGLRAPVVRNAMGWLYREGVAFDTRTGFVYMTEDKSDGRLYRFIPTRAGDLSAGKVQVARRSGTYPNYTVSWLDLPNPNPTSSSNYTRKQVSSSSAFNGGEGIWYQNGFVYFTTKGDNRVWALEPSNNRLDVIYDPATSATPVLSGVDNIVGASNGQLYVAEDGGDLQVCVINSRREVSPVLQLVGHDASEVTGIAFSPDGTRLYFSSQRGTTGSGAAGITFEVRGPFLSSSAA
jgi:secreted PhoX family phosphatase